MNSRILLVALILSMLALQAHAWMGSIKPSAAIEDTDGVFDAAVAGGVLQDVVAGSATKWITASELTTINGYAHSGQTGIDQATANSRVTLIQIWGWRDSNGNGEADPADARHRTVKTTTWTKLVELTPSAGEGDNVVGWEVSVPETASDMGDIVQGKTAISVGVGESWLFLVRCVNTSGDVNTMDHASGVEMWDNGDTSDGIGSDIPGDKYLTCDGTTPGTGAARINDTAVVWVYRGR